MRDYGKISTKIWDSKKFAKVDSDARLLYFYLHTCRNANSVGCFVHKGGYTIDDLNWNPDRYRKAMDSLCKAYLVAFDSVENLIRIVNFFEFNHFTNPKHAKGAIKIALALPDSIEKLNVLKDIAEENYASGSADLEVDIDRLSVAYLNAIDTSETETETETDIKKEDTIVSSKKPKRACQIPDDWAPNETNVADALSRGLTEAEIRNEAEQFRDHHIARGSAFKDWNAAWRTWIRNSIKFKAGRAKIGRGMAGGATADDIANRGAQWAANRKAGG